jgi:RNA polymerase sigma-70 factor (ECF subfamily)
MGEQGDTQLLAAARAGDAGALEALLVRYQSRVYRFGMRMCGDPHDAEDVLQETLLTMARSVHDFRATSTLSTWLYTIARSFCIKKRRRSKFAPSASESLEAASEEYGARVPDPRRGPEEELADRQVEALLAEAISRLDPMYREVLVLRDVEGLPAAQVAEVVGITVEAVKSRLHRARRMLRERMAPHLGVAEAHSRPAASGACPDILTLFSQHLEGEITAAVCAKMERHLHECQRCSVVCESLKRTLALCQTAPFPQVPEKVQEEIRSSVRRVLGTE